MGSLGIERTASRVRRGLEMVSDGSAAFYERQRGGRAGRGAPQVPFRNGFGSILVVGAWVEELRVQSRF
jgi:hypothetical protein